MKGKIKHHGLSEIGLMLSPDALKESGESLGRDESSFNAYVGEWEYDGGFFFDLLENAPDSFFGLTLKHAFRRSEKDGLIRKRRNKIMVEINSDSEGILVL